MEGARLVRVPSFSLRQGDEIDDQAELSVGGIPDLSTSPTPGTWQAAKECRRLTAREVVVSRFPVTDRCVWQLATFSGH